MTSKAYYSGSNGIVVTSRYVRTRHKDQALAPITLIRIGREPLFFSLALGLLLGLFVVAFGDLLYLREQIGISLVAAVMMVLGYSVASLHLGTHRHQRTMLWGAYWTVRRIRNAIVEAREAQSDWAMDSDEYTVSSASE